ncbi:MAG: hypothetical protein PVF17_09490 [Ignavibacteria bacterium]|jgi:hypothetical protein
MSGIEKLGFDNWFWESIPSGKDKIVLLSARRACSVVYFGKNSEF